MEIQLKNVRLSFNDLFEAKEFKGRYTYRATFLIEKGSENDKKVAAAIREEATALLKGKTDSFLERHQLNNMKNCYRDGDKDDREETDGHMVLVAIRQQKDGRPTIIDGKKNPLTAADGKPYSGCFVNAIVSIYVQTGDNDGIRCSLKGVQFVKDADAFSGVAAAKVDAFDEVEDGADSSDSFE